MSQAATTFIPPSSSIAIGCGTSDHTRTYVTTDVKLYNGCIWVDPVDQSTPSFVRGPPSTQPTLALVKCHPLTGEVASTAYTYRGGDRSVGERYVDIPYKGVDPTASGHSSTPFHETLRTHRHSNNDEDDDGDPHSENHPVLNPTIDPSGSDDYRDRYGHDSHSDDSRPNEIHDQGDVTIYNPRYVISSFDPDLNKVTMPVDPVKDPEASTSQATVYSCSHLIEITAPFQTPAIDNDWLPNVIVPPDNPASRSAWQKALGRRLHRRQRTYGNGISMVEGGITS